MMKNKIKGVDEANQDNKEKLKNAENTITALKD